MNNIFLSRSTGDILVLPELNDIQKEKICIIEDINKAHKLAFGKNISSERFDQLYDFGILYLRCVLEDLQRTVQQAIQGAD